MIAVRQAVRAPVGAVRRGVRGAALVLSRARRHLDAPDAVALTFDDGPDPVHTPALLDELGRLGMAATFFVVGQRAEAHPGLVRRMVGEGHAVGSHSYSHPDPWRVPLRTLIDDYGRGRAAVARAAGRSVPLFRPPKGYVDPSGAVAMVRVGVRPWLWTIDPHDWEPGADAADIVAGIDALAAGDVVLLHDAIEGPLAPAALDRDATRTALAGIAAVAGDRGLRFVTLPERGGAVATRSLA